MRAGKNGSKTSCCRGGRSGYGETVDVRVVGRYREFAGQRKRGAVLR